MIDKKMFAQVRIGGYFDGSFTLSGEDFNKFRHEIEHRPTTPSATPLGIFLIVTSKEESRSLAFLINSSTVLSVEFVKEIDPSYPMCEIDFIA
jgi:hypothetical protein